MYNFIEISLAGEWHLPGAPFTTMKINFNPGMDK